MTRSLEIRISVFCFSFFPPSRLAQTNGNCGDNSAKVPADIKAVFDKPAYKTPRGDFASWISAPAKS